MGQPALPLGGLEPAPEVKIAKAIPGLQAERAAWQDGLPADVLQNLPGLGAGHSGLFHCSRGAGEGTGRITRGPGDPPGKTKQKSDEMFSHAPDIPNMRMGEGT